MGKIWDICTDQLFKFVKKLKENPNDRRVIVSVWNPQQINEIVLLYVQ
ncbi:MAG: thymidylate synthase [Candidatus Micrarchaeia archaeon]